MKIVVFGGSGFIGKQLTSYFIKKGSEVVLVSRFEREAHSDKGKQQQENSQVRHITWHELQKNVALLEQADAFVNLAGETINQRWTDKVKKKIITSRVSTTEKEAEIVQRLSYKPKVVINGSAVGIYGMSETGTFDETSSKIGDDFLAEVVKRWEKAAELMEPYTRVIKLRLGVVLGRNGGALPKMLLPYKLFVGGKVGTGKQWLSWIHIEDLIQLIAFCITNEAIQGPINATAPHPVTNDEFGRALSKELNRPHFFPVPAFLLKLMFGEMSQMLLSGQKVIPKRILDAGFQFAYPTVEKAVENFKKKL
ncbi:MAG TPA: TIGR01777 family protein [Bacillus bacterium]|nr:TIGR01777 family protein [Bacillus sp. (in: firmicutes)]